MSVSYDADSCNAGRLPAASGCKWWYGLLGPACSSSGVCPLSIAPDPFTSVAAAIRLSKWLFLGGGIPERVKCERRLLFSGFHG